MVPTLRDLSLLSVPNWYLLGLQLGVSGDELEMIERNYPRQNDLCKVKMFGAWLRVDTSASYRKLARALVTLGERKIAESMCTARGMGFTYLNVHVHILMCTVLWEWEQGTSHNKTNVVKNGCQYCLITISNNNTINISVSTLVSTQLFCSEKWISIQLFHSEK